MIGLLLKKIKRFLSLKIVTIAILFTVIISRIIQLLFLFNVSSDRLYQMMSAQSLVAGHGISIAQVMPENLSEIIYEPLIKWPPVYTLLFAPLYSLFNHNFILSGLVLDIFFAISLIFISRRILKTLNIPSYFINLYTLFTGFILYPFYTKSTSDAIAITLFLFAVYLSLLLLKKTTHQNLKLFGLIITLWLCASTRYMYMPVIFIIPVFILIKGFADKNVSLKKAGIISLSILICALGGLLFYQKTFGGSAIYIAQPSRGFFPQNLHSLYPAIPASVMNSETAKFIFHTPYLPASSIYVFYQWINLLLTLVLLQYGLRIIIKKGFQRLSATNIFFYLTFFISLAVLALLIFLSLRVEKEGGYWTYVQEARYYGLIIVLLQLSIFIYYYHLHKASPKYLIYLYGLAFLLMLPEMFRGIIFSYNRISNFKKEETSWQTEYRFQQYAEAIIKREQTINGHINAIIAGSSSYMNKRISLRSHIPMMKDVFKINNLSSLNTKTSVLLLIVLRNDALTAFQPFLSFKEKKKQGQFNGFHFYTVYVKPH